MGGKGVNIPVTVGLLRGGGGAGEGLCPQLAGEKGGGPLSSIPVSEVQLL